MCPRKHWLSTSPAAPPSTSTSWPSIAPSGSRAKVPFWCGVTCSTSGACPMCAERCWCAKTSLFPSTASQASRCWGAVPSPWPTSPSQRCGTPSAATRTWGETAKQSASLSILWLCHWQRLTNTLMYDFFSLTYLHRLSLIHSCTLCSMCQVCQFSVASCSNLLNVFLLVFFNSFSICVCDSINV